MRLDLVVDIANLLTDLTILGLLTRFFWPIRSRAEMAEPIEDRGSLIATYLIRRIVNGRIVVDYRGEDSDEAYRVWNRSASDPKRFPGNLEFLERGKRRSLTRREKP